MYSTPESVDRRLERGGDISWSDLQDLVLARLWHATCAHRRATGQPLPPDHLRPKLADPQHQHSQGGQS